MAAPVRWFVVAAEPVTSVDVTAGDAWPNSRNCCAERGVGLHFAELKDPVKDKLQPLWPVRRGSATFSFFPTVGAAVGSYLETHDVGWTDWEDRAPG